MELLKELGIDPKVTAASVTGFFILLLILNKFLFRSVKAMIRERNEKIKSDYEAAESEKAKAEELRADYEKQIAEIESEARSRIQTAVNEANTAKNQILAEARAKSEDIFHRGQEEIAREKEKALVQLKTEVVDITISAAGKLLGETMDQSKHRKMVADFVNKIEDAK